MMVIVVMTSGEGTVAAVPNPEGIAVSPQLLLVIGYMGHSALYNRLIGSTTDRLVEVAPCQVLVVK
jgi:nucleotide-binding universal stress UspA family protein